MASLAWLGPAVSARPDGVRGLTTTSGPVLADGQVCQVGAPTWRVAEA